MTTQMIAWLTAWLLLTAPHRGADVATLYSQNFSAGASTFESVPYYNIYASGGGPTEAADSLYPGLILAHGSCVTSMTGPLGGTVNVIDRNPAWDGTVDEFDYFGLASEWRSAAVPSWGTLTDGMFPMRKLRISVDIYLPASVLAETSFTLIPLQFISDPDPSVWSVLFDVQLYKKDFPSTVYGLQVNPAWDADYIQTISAPSAGWHSLAIELQVQSHTATSATTWTNTAADGTFKLYWDGSLIFDKSGLTNMFWDMRDSEPAASGVDLGFYGITPWTNLLITNGESDGPAVAVPAGTITVTGSVPVRGEKFIDVPAAAIWLVSDPVDTGAEVIPEIGESFGPLIWVEWTGSDAVKRVWAPVDLPDPSTYYGGFKIAKLLAPGPVTRSLSDESGEYQSQVFAAQVDDSDYTIRTLLGYADTRRLIVNTLLVMRMISDPDRRALKTPRTVAIGMVRSYTLE